MVGGFKFLQVPEVARIKYLKPKQGRHEKHMLAHDVCALDQDILHKKGGLRTLLPWSRTRCRKDHSDATSLDKVTFSLILNRI